MMKLSKTGGEYYFFFLIACSGATKIRGRVHSIKGNVTELNPIGLRQPTPGGLAINPQISKLRLAPCFCKWALGTYA